MISNINWELTDTYCGESNYSWVRRGLIGCDKEYSDLAAIRRVKKAIGWNGVRCKIENIGEMIAIRPVGICQICFITFGDE